MNIPVELGSPESKLAEAIAEELVIQGFNSGLALPVAIHIMCAVDKGHDDPMLGVQDLKESRRQSDEWWVQYHPKTKCGRAAARRLRNRD